jgi:Recombinase/Recombinase zinc beta ribbon domain
MSEAELHVLKQRLHQGKLSKARRGELASALPTGYVRQANGEITLDPDEQVQQVVRLIFRKFDELGTLHAVLQYLVRHEITLGIRERCGEAKGHLVWRRPNRMTLQNLLHHPMYAGAYCYGRRQIDPRRKQPGRVSTGRVVCPPEVWHALLRDRVPAYISWETYQTNLRRLAQNRSLAETRGSARKGSALLGGLVVCGMCGRRMAVRYRDGHASYVCQNFASNYGGSSCQHMVGDELENWLAAQVLRALEPAGLALSLEAIQHAEAERADLDRLWQQRLERAHYEAERAQRQYVAVEPEHRLVARQLEAAWEGKLTEQRGLQESYERFLHEQPRTLTREQIEAIGQVTQDLPALWSAPTTTVVDRKEILRAVIERIVLRVIDHSERVQVEVFWAGSCRTQDVVCRPVKRAEQLSYYAQVCAEIRIGAQAGETVLETVARLNALGWRPPRGGRWGQQAVQELSCQLGVRRKRRRRAYGGWDGRDGRWGVTPLAREIGMPAGTLMHWIEQGEVAAEQLASGRWIIHADAALFEQLRQRRQKSLSIVTWERWQESLKEHTHVV